MFISSCGIILVFFSCALYCEVKSYGMVGVVVLIVRTLGDVSVIIRATLGGEGVYTLGVSGYLPLCAGDVYNTLGVASGFYRWA